MKKYYAYSYPNHFSSIFFPLKKEKCIKQGNERESQNLKESCHPVVSTSKNQYPKMIRQYTFTCEQDFIDIKDGFCPSYAVYWLDEHNRSHWPEGTTIRHRPEYLKKKEEFLEKINSPLSEEVFSSYRNVRFDYFNEVIPIFDFDFDDNSV